MRLANMNILITMVRCLVKTKTDSFILWQQTRNRSKPCVPGWPASCALSGNVEISP